jgi:hypothetical protein
LDEERYYPEGHGHAVCDQQRPDRRRKRMGRISPFVQVKLLKANEHEDEQQQTRSGIKQPDGIYI